MYSSYDLILQREYQEFQKEPILRDIRVCLLNNNLSHWKSYVNGPSGTCYDGGIFQLDVIVPAEFPYKPPQIKFDTKIWHPNISSQNGVIFLEVLKDHWSQKLTIKKVLESIYWLMGHPEPENPQDFVVAAQYKSDRKLFEKHAREWVQKYASSKVLDDKVRKFENMGFKKSDIVKALQKHGYEDENALAQLLKM